MFSLGAIGERIRTQDNRAASLPIFVVQQKKRTYGFDTLFVDGKAVWLDDEGNEADGDDEKAVREADNNYRATPGWRKTYCQDTWEYVMPFFTEAGAQRYLEENGHNLKEPRIYVESGYRNREWEAIRKFLAEQPSPATCAVDCPCRGVAGLPAHEGGSR